MSVTPVMLADEDSRMIGHKCRHKANRHVVERLRYTFKQPHFSFEFMFCTVELFGGSRRCNCYDEVPHSYIEERLPDARKG